MGPFVRREMVTRRLLRSTLYTWTNLFRFAQSLFGTKANSVLRSKVYLHNSSQHRCLLARSDRAPKLFAPRYTALGGGRDPAATTSSAHVSSPGSHAFAHGTPPGHTPP
jgi:hypothetical protein